MAVPADDRRLPGGSDARFAQSTASLTGARLDIELSTRPGPSATYVGSTACVGCHGRHDYFGTAHAVGLSVPGRRGYTQDTSRWPGFDAALERFEAGVTLYFHHCDRGADPPCEVSETEPADPSSVRFEVALARDASVPVGEPGAYLATLANRLGTGEVTYPIQLTYGGAMRRQLVTCGDCHEMHGESTEPHLLRVGPDDNAACIGCHNGASFRPPRGHVDEHTAPGAHDGLGDEDLVCTACHMPPTATGGALVPGLLDDRPESAVPVQYELGDLASHLYRPSGFDLAAIQPASVTQRCAVCHVLIMPNP